MAGKSSGLGDNFYVAGYDLSGDTNGFDRIGGGPATTEVTGIDKSAVERLGVKRDGGMSWATYFNDAAGGAHTRYSLLPTADAVASYFRGTAIGNAAASLVGKQINYDGSRADDGSLLFKVEAQANGYGLEWGRQLTAGKRTDSTATNGTSLDQTTASTALGWQAWLHVFAFTGTSVTVKVQDSADNSAWADLSGAAFTAATGVTSQRLESASRTDTVRRYVRVATTGTFSNAIFAVMFTRNDVAVTW